MKIGAVLPHNEIGTEAGAMRAWAQGVEALGADHILIYDHVLGADPDRPGGFRGPYDKDVAFHEPLTTLSFIAGVTKTIELMPAVLILPQRQTALVAKQAAELAILSDGRFRLGIGTGWNQVEYQSLNEDFGNRGPRQAEQVELLRLLWSSDSLDYKGDYHAIPRASINPRPDKLVPIWFGGSAPVLIRRCARLGDGWIPVMGPNPAAAAAIAELKSQRAALGLPWEGFGIQAQAQYAGGNPDRWIKHAGKWREIGATHLAVATHNAGESDVDRHLRRFEEYLEAVPD
ncbi:MAG: LLM class F420-dependent oxidoreductase [Proteobacteria bacterium]|jgi:probable F420-dependent oxidoreductase|nr:LLM class F420-dependent oxidoreductase [Pseudomonadota bacterium]MDA1300006.1 LLM class F420-dependent oxidoreductase [Pseudomonadota bacterium]